MAPFLDHGRRDQRRWEISVATCVLAASASASLLAVHRQRQQQQQRQGDAPLDSTGARVDASTRMPTIQSAWGNFVSTAHDIRSAIGNTTKPLLDFTAAAFNRTRAAPPATAAQEAGASNEAPPVAARDVASSEQPAADVKPQVVIPPLVFSQKRDASNDEAFEDSIRNSRAAWGPSKSSNPPTDVTSSADGAPAANTTSPSQGNRRNFSPRKHEELSSRGYAVSLGDLKVWISHEYDEEAAFESHPMYMRTFVRDDGTQIILTAEDLSSVLQSLDSPAYRARCVERVRQAALEKQTYFKVKLNIDSNAVVTSVFEQFVDLIIGPGPMDAASFFVVSGHIGYTLQMQAELGAYESRLAEFLTTVQGARLTPVVSRFHGANHHTLCAADKSEVYNVVIPPQFLVKRSGEGMLAVQFRHRSSWKGEILTWKPKLTAAASSEENDVVELVPGKLFFSSKLSAVVGTPIGSEITMLLTTYVRGSVAEAQTPQSGSSYISDIWTLPLPQIDTCITNVCEHLQGSGITLFIETKNGDQVEVILTAAYVNDVSALKSEMSTKISPSPKLRSKKDSHGRSTIHAEGKSVEAPYTPVGIDAIEYSPGLWVTITWNFPESASHGNAIPSELARYPTTLNEELAFRELPVV